VAFHARRLRLLLKLVFITQQVDPEHPALAATVPKLRALAARVEEVVVLADAVVADVLPANCRVRTFRAARRVGRGVRFEAALAAEVPGLRGGGAVVAHMCPVYAVLAAPLLRPLRIPLVLWYTHWHASGMLRLAERASTRIATVDSRSFPLNSPKVRAIGHGIDLAEFRCASADGAGPALRLIALGRYSPAKGLEVVLRALRIAVDDGLDVRLDAYGPVLTPLEQRHRAELSYLIDDLALDGRAQLADAVPRARVPRLLAAADALVNNMRAGAPDKVVYEAAATCLPVLASNPVFDDLLPPEFVFPRDDPEVLAERLVSFARLDPPAREALGRRLRERVEQRHSVETWADGILAAAEPR
jgi:glycosyltransferase involved in cell wall biosynthesis